jgi:dTDP-glucose 4,6-dehydratase
MKLLITGGAGFIGSAVVKLALQQKITVLNLDSLSYAGNINNLKNLPNEKNYKFIKLNILNSKKITEVLKDFRPDYIMHFAASSHVDNAISSPKEFIRVNIEGTFNLLEGVRGLKRNFLSHNIKFHYISTDEVYGSLGRKGSFVEEDKLDPKNPYSASKAAAQHLVTAWGNTYDIPYIITNCSNNFGPYQHPEKFIPKIIINALTNKKIPIYGNGKNIRDWLHVFVHADCLIQISKKGKIGEIYNIGGMNELSNLNIVKKICKFLDKKIQPNSPYSDLINFVKDRPGHDFRYAINSSKINKSLKWYPNISFDDGLKETINWYIDNEKWWKRIIKI